MNLTDLALRRAGASDLKDFQQREDLYPSGREDTLTMQRLSPYILGYERYMVKPGDTFYKIAQRFQTTVQAILTANPNQNPNNLIPRQYLTVPYGFPVVPTDMPFTSELLQICLQGLLTRYPFIRRYNIARTEYGRCVPVIQLGTGQCPVLYNASHHANEWITTTILMKFLEQYACAVASNGRIFGADAMQLYQNTRLFLVPMVNPDGVDLVTGAIEPGSEQYEAARAIAEKYPDIPFPDGWKANLHGVDLNLNYPAMWEQAKEIKYAKGFTGPAPRDYVGRSPLNQQESAGMVGITRFANPALTISYHSQGEEIYWKFLDIAPERAQEFGEQFAQISGYSLEDTPYASGFAGYKDWFILTNDRPGYTIEVGLGESPLPLSQFDSIYEKNIGILTLGLQLR